MNARFFAAGFLVALLLMYLHFISTTPPQPPRGRQRFHRKPQPGTGNNVIDVFEDMEGVG